MPVTSDASPFTSVTASPMEAHDPEDTPIELKIPLPASSACSDEEEIANSEVTEHQHDPPGTAKVEAEDIHPEAANLRLGEPQEEANGPSVTGTRPEIPHVSLEELAHLVDLENYQRLQAVFIQARRDHLTLSCGLDRRLISTLTIAYGNMIDQYKTDDQAGFAGLYEACEQLRTSCNMTGPSVGNLGMRLDQDTVPIGDMETRSYIQMLPPDSQGTVLTFLTQMRTDPHFLPDRICNLSPSELTVLTSSYHPAGIDYSVLQNHSHGKTQIYSRDSQMMKLSRRMDNLHRFHNEDPFFALLYGVFDSSAKPGSLENHRRTDIWSTICAQNFVKAFTETRPGSDEMAIATLDAFANFHDWPLKPRVETYLMRILSEGFFLLDAPSKQPVEFIEPIEMHNAKAAILEADFFENALTGLLELLTSDGSLQAVPESALAFSHAVLRKIEDPKLRLRAKRYIVCSWYFATFISSVLVYPEVRGIMMTHHIGDSARKLILQPLVIRLQQRVFDVVLQWNGHALVKPEILDGIMAIFDSFDPPTSNKDALLPLTTEHDDEVSTRFLMLSPLDIIGLVHALYPERLANPGAHESELTAAVSDRPSTAGSSTLINTSSDAGSGLAPSTAPSTAEASVISTKDANELSATNQLITEQSSQDLLQSDSKAEVAKASPMIQKDFAAGLAVACRRIRNAPTHDRASRSVTSLSSWALIYYSRDGSAMVVAPGPEASDLYGPREIGQNKPTGVDNHDKDYNVLKMAVTKLLAEDDRSGLEALLTLASPETTETENHHDPLKRLIEAAMNKAHSQLDFATAHSWWKTLGMYQDFLTSNLRASFHSVLQDVSMDLTTSIGAAAKDAKVCEVQCQSLDRLQKYHHSVLAEMEQQRKALRVKMWYVSDVRHSATYEEALHVTRALRSMARSKRTKQPGSISNWARQRLRGPNLHDRTEAQVLEAVVAPKEHGGPSKLADEQVELTSRWLTRKSVENFCKGEERIHRFCYEVQRSVGKIAGASMLDNPVLWSSNLFRRERSSFDTQRLPSSGLGPPSLLPSGPFGFVPSQFAAVAAPGAPPRGLGFVSSKTRSPQNSIGGFWSAGQASRPSTGLPSYGNQPLLPPTPTSPPNTWSNNPFGPSSPLHTFTPPTPFGGHGSHPSNDGESSPAKKIFAEQIKQTLCSLLISDLGYLLWNQGSETDIWINEHAGDHLDAGQPGTVKDPRPLGSESSPAPGKSHSDATSGDAMHRGGTSNSSSSAIWQPPETISKISPQSAQREAGSSFPFAKAYATLLRSMSLTHDPWTKLRMLSQLEDLVLMFLQDSRKPITDRLPLCNPNPSLRSKSVPRTKATRLEEVMANCTERRAGTMRTKGLRGGHSLLDFAQGTTVTDNSGTDDVINTLLFLFRDHNLRPKTLFRDLQYIAAFIPSETLDQTAQGKAFWDAGLAALALKEDVCESMISRANEITAYHISTNKPSNTSADDMLASTTLKDAAKLWLIAAKEGSPIAARELGLFYLTHPELLPRVTMPFSKAKDVFKSVMSNDFRPGDRERGALDPLTFAVVFHWMEVAANGGDKDARDFLKANGELSGGW